MMLTANTRPYHEPSELISRLLSLVTHTDLEMENFIFFFPIPFCLTPQQALGNAMSSESVLP